MVQITEINVKGVDHEIVDFNARKKIEDLEDNKQNKLTFDTVPTASSMNPVTSDGIYHAIQGGGFAQQQSDWGEVDSTKVTFIKNKVVDSSQITSLDATKVTGVLAQAQIPVLDSAKIPVIDASKLTGVNGALPTLNNVSVSTWVADSTYADYPYKATIPYTGVTTDYLPSVVYAVEEADSGDYAPICESGVGVVYIWSALNTTITVPTVSVTKVL